MLSSVLGNARLSYCRRRTYFCWVQGTLVWIDVGGRSMLCFLQFARRSLNWSVVPSCQAFYCSPGARAECLQRVFVVIGGRLRGTIQRSSSLTSSSSSRVVYEWRRPKSSVVWKQSGTSSSEVQQRREEPLNLLYYYLGDKTRWY